uniref:Uncharacterized protein n=1 Tax=Cacopsylla melanoneura TaxID=428564 RepID=A0A8D8Q5H4_9HEMI
MDKFTIVTQDGKTRRLHYEGFNFAYSGPIGGPGAGCQWGCVVRTCPAHVKLNNSKDTIIGGKFTHNHDCPSKPTPTTSSKLNSPKLNSLKPSNNQSPKISNNRVNSTPVIDHSTPVTNKDVQTSGTPSTPKEQGPPKNTDDSSLDLSFQRDAAINKVMEKQMDLDNAMLELTESRKMIESLHATISVLEAGWEADRNELNELRRQLSGTNTAVKTKLTVIGDSHVKFLGPVLCKTFPSSFEINCLAQSGAIMADVATRETGNHSNQDVIVIVAGTNDVCKTSWKSFAQALDTLFAKYQSTKLGFILIPSRKGNCEINTHIESLNERIVKHFKGKNVFFLNPKIVLKNKHFAKDGLHLNKVGRLSLCSMMKSGIVDNKRFDNVESSEPNDKSKRAASKEKHENQNKTVSKSKTTQPVSKPGNKKNKTKTKSNKTGNTSRNINTNTNNKHINKQHNNHMHSTRPITNRNKTHSHYNNSENRKHQNYHHSYQSHSHSHTGRTQYRRQPQNYWVPRHHYSPYYEEFYDPYNGLWYDDHYDQGGVVYNYQQPSDLRFDNRGYQSRVFYPSNRVGSSFF